MRRFDYVVVGAGIAGLSLAARLVSCGSVLVCEAEEAPGVHASGRSAAFAHFGIGDDLVRRLTALSLRHFAAPVARPHPAMFLARQEDLGTLDGLAAVHREWAPSARRLSAEEIGEMVPILRTGDGGFVAGLLHPDGMKLDSDAMLQAHRHALSEAGGELAVRSPVTALRRDGEIWVIDTAGESFAATVVVNAAGAWADRIAALAGVRPLGIRPLRRTVITFAGPEGIDVSPWPFTKTVGPGFYFEPEGKGRLLASPMDETPCEPCDAAAEEEDVALAAWRVEEATTLRISRIASRWAGLRSFAPDDRPVVGFDPGVPGFFWLAGQGGFGLQTSPALSLAAQALVTRQRWPDELEEFAVAPEQLSPSRLR